MSERLASDRSRVTAATPTDMETWAIWYPKAGSTGLLLARGRLKVADTVLVHAAPDVLTAEVNDDQRRLVAIGEDLQRSADSPMCHLSRGGSRIQRTDLWPTDEHLGLPVLLPGGEVGLLRSWWHSSDRKEWRWNLEFYNSIREEDRSTWLR